jgi:hypothetical protein
VSTATTVRPIRVDTNHTAEADTVGTLRPRTIAYVIHRRRRARRGDHGVVPWEALMASPPGTERVEFAPDREGHVLDARTYAAERPWTPLAKLGHTGDLPGGYRFAGTHTITFADGSVATGLAPNTTGTGIAGTTKAHTSRANGAKGGRPSACGSCGACKRCERAAKRREQRAAQRTEREAARIADAGVVGRV